MAVRYFVAKQWSARWFKEADIARPWSCPSSARRKALITTKIVNSPWKIGYFYRAYLDEHDVASCYYLTNLCVICFNVLCMVADACRVLQDCVILVAVVKFASASPMSKSGSVGERIVYFMRFFVIVWMQNWILITVNNRSRSQYQLNLKFTYLKWCQINF